MPFQARGKKLPLALSKKRWLVCGCHVAVGRISTILSLLCSVTDSHVVHRLHNEAGLGEPADVIVSYTASGWQKDSLLQWCYYVREREKEAEGAYWFLCAMACVFVDGGCICWGVGRFIHVHFRTGDLRCTLCSIYFELFAPIGVCYTL